MLHFVQRYATPCSETALAPYEGTLAKLLLARGCRNAAEAERFLHPGMEHLHDPMLLADMPVALELLAQAKAERWPVVVYGDYDCDGVCATSLLLGALRAYGLDAAHYVPLRSEGYGLNLPAVEKLAQSYRLLVTVDLGVTNIKEVLRARELGMRVLVTDHHQLGLEECPADAVLNPLRGDYPFGRLCGTGVAFKLAQALLGWQQASEWLDLVALATVADIVPLLEENRALVTLGLPKLGKRAGIAALLNAAGVTDAVSSETLGFQLGPRLNAAGRMDDANDAVRLLTTDDPAEAAQLAKKLDTINTRRKQVESELLAQASAQVQAHDFVAEHALIVKGTDWHTGVIGLVAGRLNRTYHAPVCVLSEQDGLLHGSLRSVRGVNIHRCLQDCDDLLLRYGGHEQAAGVTLAAEQYDAFCERLQHAVDARAAQDAFVPAQEYDLPLDFAEANGTLLEQLSLLQPFGCDNPAPIFYGRGVHVERCRACGASGAHLQLTLRQGERVLNGIGFGMGDQATRLTDAVDVAFSLGWNEYMGRKSVQCRVEGVASALSPEERIAAAQEEAALLRMLPDTPAKEGFSTLCDEEIPSVDVLAQGAQGTLAIAHTRETARAFLAHDPDGWQLSVGSVADPYCYNTLLLCPEPEAIRGCWRTLALLDGATCPQEVARWRQALPNARIVALAPSEALRQLASRMDAGDAAYRELYRLLRRTLPQSLRQTAELAGLTEPQTIVGLRAFRSLSLARFTEAPFSVALCEPNRCALSDSPILGALRALTDRKEASGC